MQATLTSKGQITIPVGVRRRLQLRAGDRLEFDETAPRKNCGRQELEGIVENR